MIKKMMLRGYDPVTTHMHVVDGLAFSLLLEQAGLDLLWTTELAEMLFFISSSTFYGGGNAWEAKWQEELLQFYKKDVDDNGLASSSTLVSPSWIWEMEKKLFFSIRLLEGEGREEKEVRLNEATEKGNREERILLKAIHEKRKQQIERFLLLLKEAEEEGNEKKKKSADLDVEEGLSLGFLYSTFFHYASESTQLVNECDVMTTKETKDINEVMMPFASLFISTMCLGDILTISQLLQKYPASDFLYSEMSVLRRHAGTFPAASYYCQHDGWNEKEPEKLKKTPPVYSSFDFLGPSARCFPIPHVDYHFFPPLHTTLLQPTTPKNKNMKFSAGGSSGKAGGGDVFLHWLVATFPVDPIALQYVLTSLGFSREHDNTHPSNPRSLLQSVVGWNVGMLSFFHDQYGLTANDCLSDTSIFGALGSFGEKWKQFFLAFRLTAADLKAGDEMYKEEEGERIGKTGLLLSQHRQAAVAQKGQSKLWMDAVISTVVALLLLYLQKRRDVLVRLVWRTTCIAMATFRSRLAATVSSGLHIWGKGDWLFGSFE